MHAPSFDQGASPSRPRIWLIAGTGEGPRLAQSLLEAGWTLRVSVVNPSAARAYGPHPALQLAVGAIASHAEAPALNGVKQELTIAQASGQPYHWVIDASHPFASQITLALEQGCNEVQVPLLRLKRPELGGSGVTILQGMEELRGLARRDEHWLLAIGARRLVEAVCHSQGARHHARILPRPLALQQAMAAGLPPERVACLQPLSTGSQPPAVEQALCRNWRIETVLCRRSGGPGEVHWRRICSELGLRLLLLDRPRESSALVSLPLELLLERIGPAAALPLPVARAKVVDSSQMAGHKLNQRDLGAGSELGDHLACTE